MNKLWQGTLILLTVALLSACGSTRNTDKYDYLTKKDATLKKNEPFEVVSLSVLDTVGRSKPVVVTPPVTPKPDVPSTTGSSSKVTAKALAEAKTYIGVPYLFGGSTRKGIDCSALMMLSYAAAGVTLPRTSSQQSQTGKRVSKNKIRTGDLLFFDTSLKGRVNHVGLVSRVKSGEIYFIHATTSRGVVEDVLSNRYYTQRYKHAMRP